MQSFLPILHCKTFYRTMMTVTLLLKPVRVLNLSKRIGSSYKDAGQPKKLVLPQGTHDAIKRLRAICEPQVQAMPDRQ